MDDYLAYRLAFILCLAYSFPSAREQTASAGDTLSAHGVVPAGKAWEQVIREDTPAILQGLINSNPYHSTFYRWEEKTLPTKAPMINVGLAWVYVDRFHLLL